MLGLRRQVKTDDGTHHMLVDKFFGVEDRAAQEVDDTVVAARRCALFKLTWFSCFLVSQQKPTPSCAADMGRASVPFSPQSSSA